MPARSRAANPRGFTLIETVMVVAIGLILMAVTAVNVDRVVEQTRGDSALYAVMSQLRQAHGMAINRRRSIGMEFIAPNQIRLTRHDIPAGTTLLSDVYLEGHVQFRQFPGTGDTPDGFGNANAVDFDGENPLFSAEGMLVDDDGAPLSGTVFLGIDNEPASARAVTVFGGTGQVRGYAYHWPSNAWIEQ